MRFSPIAAIIVILAALDPSCSHAADLPNPRKTPGVANPIMTKAKLCAMKFTTRDERHVTEATKRQVYASYGMAKNKKPCPCEVDHLISLEIGGANNQRNLWPQSYITKPWNAHVKDTLENHLHRVVCSGQSSLKLVQHEIRNNWITAWRKYIGKPHARTAMGHRVKSWSRARNLGAPVSRFERRVRPRSHARSGVDDGSGDTYLVPWQWPRGGAPATH